MRLAVLRGWRQLRVRLRQPRPGLHEVRGRRQGGRRGQKEQLLQTCVRCRKGRRILSMLNFPEKENINLHLCSVLLYLAEPKIKFLEFCHCWSFDLPEKISENIHVYVGNSSFSLFRNLTFLVVFVLCLFNDRPEVAPARLRCSGRKAITGSGRKVLPEVKPRIRTLGQKGLKNFGL